MIQIEAWASFPPVVAMVYNEAPYEDTGPKSLHCLMSCGGQQVTLQLFAAHCLCCRAAGCRSSWSASGVAPKSHFLPAAWQVASSGKHCILSTTTGTAHTVTFQACGCCLLLSGARAHTHTHWECLTHRLCKKYRGGAVCSTHILH